MPIIIIRHSDDETYCEKKHDCPINPQRGSYLAKKVGKKLVDKYGIPDIIILSPFRRTIETMNYMIDVKNQNIQVIEDNKLCRYFNQREKENPDVYKETLKKNIPIKESYNEFKERVDIFCEYMQDMNIENKTIWVITHALVYKKISKFFHKKTSSHINFMENFTLSGEFCKKCGFSHV